MNLTKILFLILLAFILSILDTSFFSFIPIFGATIISSYVAIINFSINGKINEFLLFTIAVIFFFSAFSSLPVWLIVAIFLLVPYLIFYIKKSYFPEPSTLSSLAFFSFATFLFALASLLYDQEWHLNRIAVGLYFILINSAFGVFFYYLSKKIRKNFAIKDIKF